MQRLGEAIYPKVLRDVDLLTALADGVVVVDADGNILYMNAPAMAMHGLSADEVNRHIDHYSGTFTLTTLEGETLEPADWPANRVIRGERFSNRRFWVELSRHTPRALAYSGTPVYWEGRFAYALLTLRDVTAEETAHRRVQESENRFRSAMEQYPRPVLIYTADLTIGFANAPAAERLDRSRDKFIGLGASDFDPALSRLCIPLIEKASATREAVQEEANLILRGERIELMLTFVPLLDEHGQTGQVLGIATDLTEVHRTKTELQVMVNELETFAHAVSHDLKTPLRAVTAFSEILLEEAGGLLGQEHRDMLERIHRAGLKMSDLLDGVLRLTRMVMEPYQPDRVNLTSLVERHVREYSLGENGISVVFPPTLWVYADDRLLLLVLDNLLRNAVKFTRDAAQPLIRVGHAHDRDGERVCFVSDNGIGFDPGESARMFEPFQRFHHDEGFEGSGIGLAIARRAIERHGGRIWAESEPGRGATFFFTLPLSEDEQPDTSEVNDY